MNLRVSSRSILFAVVIVSVALPSLAPAQSSCQPGTYASLATGSCEPCEIGRYQPAIGQEACFFCEPGRFTDVQGRTACAQCGPGRFQGLPGASTCNACAPGSFRDATGQTSCDSCAPGRFAHVDASTACAACGPGRFSDVTGATSCESCDPGRYATDTGASTCRSCDPGRYATDAAAATCRTCGPGRFSGVAGATTCDSCPPGRFSGATLDPLGDPLYASTCVTPNAYSCYKTKDLKSPPFTSTTLSVTDAYTSGTQAKIKGPVMVCAPVDVGSGIEDASARQCCYKVAAPGLAKPRPKIETTGGTLTGSQLEVQKFVQVCEPCGDIQLAQ